MVKRVLKYLVCCLLIGTMGSAFARDKQELMVFAAGSLSSAFKEIGLRFEEQNPDVKVVINFAAAGVLIQQMEQGAPADVFASADQEMMNRADTKGLIVSESRRDFAQNMLVVVLPISSELYPQRVEEFSDARYRNIGLGRPGITPAGNYIQNILQEVNLWDTLEDKFVFAEHVTQVVRYVSTAEVDAGFVFRSDALRHADSLKIAFAISKPEDFIYPIAQTSTSQQAELAQRFIAFVLSAEGREVLTEFGFDVAEFE